MPIYQLSNAQRKDLLVRGTPVAIVLPAGPEDPQDLIDWARSVLPADVRHLVHDARNEVIEVCPKPTGPRATLTDLLGAIVNEPPPADWFTIWIDCVLVQLQPPGNQSRHKGGRPQWPVNVVIGGKPLLSPNSGNEND